MATRPTSNRSIDATARAAWRRALELTASLDDHPTRIFPRLVDELAARFGAAPALIGEDATWSFRELALAANRYARWGLEQGIAPGDVVALMMSNGPDYLAIWLGLTRIGGVVALVNPLLVGDGLAHAISIVAPRLIVIGGETVPGAASALAGFPPRWVHGTENGAGPRLDLAVADLPGTPLAPTEDPAPSLADRALYLYTSGTTGLPKAAAISHRRIMQWSHWFAGLMATGPSDRLYDCLPMHHSVGGIVAIGATLIGGGAVVLRRRFSATRFWSDVVATNCTLFQYVGELCRYLVNTPPQPQETQHRLRLACGNGLAGDVWERFESRFRIPQIIEFYAATEAPFSLYNCEGRPGSIGRIPGFLAHRLAVALVRYDTERGLPLRDAEGRCVPCAPDEVGEAIARLSSSSDKTGAGSFEGYIDRDESEKKLLRDVFAPGDVWYRSGDLMRRDAEGFFYFVDRIGDTFRWKGENVATTEVATVVSQCAGVSDAVVFGVTVPGADGRAGMAAIVAGAEFDLERLNQHLAARLPDFARPLFIRLVDRIATTATFKPRKHELAAAGFDPALGRVFVFDRDGERFEPLDAPLHARILSGAMRL